MILKNTLNPFAKQEAIVDTNLVMKDQIIHVNNSGKKDYPFVNLIRFTSMMGIVWAHITIFPKNVEQIEFLKNFANDEGYMFFMQFFKFGVLCFFLISGYLFGSKDVREGPFAYFQRRVKSTIKPYIIVATIVFVISAFRMYILHRQPALLNPIKLLEQCIFETSLWYLPNYLMCLGILLFFLKYLRRKWFGMLLLLTTVAYTVYSVYFVQYELSHQTAMLAFIFYLWLGFYIKQHDLVLVIYKQNTMTLVVIAFSLYILSSLESYYLFKHGFHFFFNILRFSNQLYSLSMFCLMVKLSENGINFKFFNPRRETYGIYLFHGLLTGFCLPKLAIWAFEYLQLGNYIYKIEVYIPVFLFLFFLCYFTTLFLVRFLMKYKLAFL